MSILVYSYLYIEVSMLFNRKKFVVINEMNNTCVSYVSPTNIREDINIKRALKFSKKEAVALVNKLQFNMEFVKYRIHEAWI